MPDRSNFDDVGDFHQKFALANSTHERAVRPHPLDPELIGFRLRFLQEELNELVEGYAEQDLPKVFDALIDLVYVALGTAQLHHFPWQAGWDAVQRANMQKERAVSASQSKRGSSFDVVKPVGWKSPNLVEVLMAAGWQGPDLFPRGAHCGAHSDNAGGA